MCIFSCDNYDLLDPNNLRDPFYDDFGPEGVHCMQLLWLTCLCYSSPQRFCSTRCCPTFSLKGTWLISLYFMSSFLPKRLELYFYFIVCLTFFEMHFQKGSFHKFLSTLRLSLLL